MTRAPAVLLGLIVLGAAAPSLGRGTGGDQPGRALFERAEASFDQGRFADARADYQAAYDRDPLPELLFDIGQCYRNLGEYEQARAYFERYAELEPDSPNRAATERLAAEMDREARQRVRQPRAVAITTAVAAAPRVAPPSVGLQALAPPLGPTVQRAAPKPPVYRRTWFWLGIGGAIATGAAVAFIASRDTRSATLAPIDAR
jgi:tetratricopeptide (TPR) repeat protein